MEYGFTAKSCQDESVFEGVLQTGAVGFKEKGRNLREVSPEVDVETSLKYLVAAYKKEGSEGGN